MNPNVAQTSEVRIHIWYIYYGTYSMCVCPSCMFDHAIMNYTYVM
jgi:hypothetical protein